MKIYHAHGFVVRNNFPADGEERWNANSNFSKVFGDLESAKNYLLNCFEERLCAIYISDEVFSPGVEERKQIWDKSSLWRREYVDKYIWYNLLISEIDSDIWGNERNKNAPDEIVWYLRYTGEVCTRYFVFGDKDYEFRPCDEQGDAGTKFSPGDIVKFTDWEDDRCNDLYVIYEAPQPAKEGAIWQNHYTALGIGLYEKLPRVYEEIFHEADLTLCPTEILEHYPYGKQLIALQSVIKGDIALPEKAWRDILHGRILFNECLSWRDIPELFNLNDGKR